jgi:Ca-activated chloride channel homolog
MHIGIISTLPHSIPTLTTAKPFSSSSSPLVRSFPDSDTTTRHPRRCFHRAPLALILLAAAPLVRAQTQIPSDTPTSLTPDTTVTLKVQSTIVAVSAIVRDAAGKPVTGLSRSNFLLKQDGKPQPVTYFSQGSDLPLTLALMVDTSGSQRRYIADEIAAGHAFFPAMLKQPADRAVLVQFDSNILQLAKITSNVTTLEHALAYLSQSHDDYGVQGHGGTLLYDAICGVSRMEFSNQPGRRAMVILTDGGDNGSHFHAKDAIRAAQAADIMIYSVYYSNGGGDLDALNKLSKATGGRVFEVGPDNTLQQIYAEIADDMRLEYQLGYQPPKSKPGKYHKLDLAATNKALLVQSRAGYFTPK